MTRTLLFLLIAALAFAQEERTYELDTTLVTATRDPRPLREISLSTTVLDHSKTQVLQPFDLAEAVKSRAGIDILQYGGIGSVSTISVRGITSTGVLLLRDGRPTNSILTGSGDLSMIPYSLAERIEIIKGPTSALYGANGLGGAVNIVTEKTGNVPGFDAQFIIADPRLHDYSAGVLLPWRDLKYQFDAELTRSNGVRSNSDYENTTINNRLGVRLASVQVSGALGYTTRDLGLSGPLPALGSLPVFGDSSASSLFDNQKDAVWLADLKAKGKISSALYFEAALYGDRTRLDFHTQYPGFAGDTIIEDYNWLVSTAGGHGILSRQQANARIALGIDARYDSLKSVLLSSQPGDTTWHAVSRNFGAWIDATIRVSPVVTFDVGNRYDLNRAYGSFWSTQLGVILALSADRCLKASVGQAFRAPTFNDLYLPKYGNRELKPEQGVAAELGVNQSFGKIGTTGMTAFYRDVTDKIAWQPGAGGTWHPVNVNSVTISGVEALVSVQPLSLAKLQGDLTVQEATQKNRELVYSDMLTDSMAFAEVERRAAYVPKRIAGVVCLLYLPYRTTATVRFHYSGDRLNYYEDYTNYPSVEMTKKALSSSLAIDVGIFRHFGRYLKLGIGAKNLLNETYALQFGNTTRDRDYPMPGRSIFAQISTEAK